MTDKEIKQTKAVLAALREENEKAENKLASIVTLLASLRKNYLTTKLTLDIFEEKLDK